MGTQKIVINAEYGGFSLSDAGARLYAELKGFTLYGDGKFDSWSRVPLEVRQPDVRGEAWAVMPLEERVAYNRRYQEETFTSRDIPRDDAALIEVVETLGSAANGLHAGLTVVEIPANVEWEIEEYDGLEWVAEKHRTWR